MIDEAVGWIWKVQHCLQPVQWDALPSYLVVAAVQHPANLLPSATRWSHTPAASLYVFKRPSPLVLLSDLHLPVR